MWNTFFKLSNGRSIRKLWKILGTIKKEASDKPVKICELPDEAKVITWIPTLERIILCRDGFWQVILCLSKMLMHGFTVAICHQSIGVSKIYSIWIQGAFCTRQKVFANTWPWEKL